ncbi:alginate lyase family protein [Streptococcus hongkongensis]|nr:oligohyaluronate lyase [Streptococcus uberis]
MESKTETLVSQFFKSFEEGFCRDYIKTYNQTDYKRIKENVDLLMENTFIFNDNWDMEPCPVPYHLEVIHWDKQVTDDPEWNFMLNRQSYLYKLVVVYLVEGDDKYLDKIKYFIFDWIGRDYLLDKNSLTSRTLDTGIRCLAWLKALLFLKRFNAISKTEEDKIISSVRKQFVFLYDNYIEKYTLSNWGILQTTAILAWFYYYEDAIQLAEIKEFAEKELFEQIRLQVLEDGSQYEQSIMYHVEVYRSLLELAILVPSYKGLYQSTLVEMSEYIYMMTGPDHHQFAFGDSDVTDTRDILTMSAVLLQSNRLASKSFNHLDIESLLYFGEKGVETFKELKPLETCKEGRLFESSGHVCLHDHRRFLFYKCGPLGSAHSHSDQNSICLYDQGRPIFVDPGRYTYEEDSLRHELRSSKGHSTCLIDDQAVEAVKDSWSYFTYPNADYLTLKEENDLSLIESSFSSQLEDGVKLIHKRSVLALPHGITLILDKLNCPGEHRLTTQFILDDQVIFNEQTVNDLQLTSDNPFREEQLAISKRYNEFTQSKKIVKEAKFKDVIYDYTLLTDKNCLVKRQPLLQTGSNKELKNSFGFEIIGDDYHYVIGIQAEDILSGDKLYKVDGVKCRGKIVVIDKKSKNIYRLKS